MTRMHWSLQIVVVLLLSYAVCYAVDYWLFGDKELFTLSKTVAWIWITALLVYLLAKRKQRNAD